MANINTQDRTQYTAHMWETGEPITQERMTAIEQQLATLSTESSIDRSNEIALLQEVVNANTIAGQALQTAADASANVTTAQNYARAGMDAWQQIEPLVETTNERDSSGNLIYTKTLEQIMNTLNTEVFTAQGTNLRAQVDKLLQDMGNALVYDSVYHPEQRRTFDTLEQRLRLRDDLLFNHDQAIITLNQNYEEAGGGNNQTLNGRLVNDERAIGDIQAILEAAKYSHTWHPSTDENIQQDMGSLDERFEYDENEIQTIKGWINDAKSSTAKNASFNSIDARMEDIESEIITARNGAPNLNNRIATEILPEIEALNNNKLNKSALTTRLDISTTGQYALDAAAGKDLDDAKLDKTTFQNAIINNCNQTAAGGVLDARQGKILKDTIGTGFDSTNTVAARIDAIDNASTGTVKGLSDKITTIAEELAMLDNQGVIKRTNTKIDDLERDVQSLADELSMGRDNGALITANTRIDNLDNDINAAQTGLKAHMTAAETNISNLNTVLGNASSGLTKRVGDLETTIGDDTSGLAATKAIADANKSAIENATTGLAATKAIADQAFATANNAATSTTVSNLTTRVDTLEGKDTIVVVKPADRSNYTNNIPNLQDPSSNADYLIQDDEGKYFYWRYISNNWELISGAGGGGTGSSSGMFISSLDVFEGQDALTPDENIDYFVGNGTIGYTHYRYLIPDGSQVGSFVRILPKGLLLNASVNANGGLVAGTVENPSGNVFNTFVALKSVDSEIVTDSNGNAAGTKLTFVDTNGTSYPITVQGGGSGSGSTYTVKLNNEMGTLSLTVPDIEGTVTTLQARVVVKDGSEIAQSLGSALNITTQYRTNTSDAWSTFETRTVDNNVSFGVNVSSLLRTGVKTYIRLVLTTTLEEQEITRTINYEVTKVEMAIVATNFNQAIVRTSNLVFQYKCLGSNLTKEVHFKVDGVDIVTPVTTTSHNEPLQQIIPLTGKSAGMHSFQVYFTVNGVSSNVLNYYILYNSDTSNTAPMIALAAENPTITFGDALNINYTTAVNSSIETMDDVQLELYTMSGSTKTVIASTELTNVRNERVHTWTPIEYPEQGTVYVTAAASRTVGSSTLTDTNTIQVTINPLSIDYNLNPAGEENLLYKYTAFGRSNNDLGKEQFQYTYTSSSTGNPQITWTGAFNNFNWSTDGYDGEALVVSGGATHTIDVPVFASKTANDISLETDAVSYTDPTQNGRTIEIEYEVQSATDLNDVIIDCMDNNHVGFRVTPQSCYLLNNNVNVSLAQDGTGTILNEDAIAAAYLTTGVRTHLAFVIEPWAETKAYDQKYHQSVNIYINGEFANACPYLRDNSTGNISDSFKTNATIRIGSASCIIKIYSIKLYNRGLTNTEILQNYKTAPGRTADKLARFRKNDILTGGFVDYEKARKMFNCLLLVGPEPVIRQNEQGQDYNAMPTISPYKGAPSPIGRSKDNEIVGKTESGLILTYPDGNIDGYKTEFNLCDIMTDGGYASSNNVQGTSSQKYPIHNLKIYLMKGTEGQEELDANTGEPTGRYKKSEKVKYKLPGSKGKGESTLCWKADYMSTDHANTYNANIADSLFSESLNPAITNEDWQTKVQNTVHGIRCLLFKKEGNNAPEFVADGCLNNDKGNSKTYGLEYPAPSDPAQIDPNAEYDSASDATDTVAQKWEFTNNSDDLGFFKYDCLFYPTGNDQHYRALDAFESCYPDQGDLDDAGLVPNYNHLQVLSTWVSQRANYWDETNPTTRAQKKEIFRNEFTKHFNLDHVLVYYLFSEYVALCDNRVKNMFMRSDTIRKEHILKKDGTTIFQGNSNPNADFWKTFTNVDTGEVDAETGQAIIEHRVTNESQIDWANSTFAIWAPVLYDLDSCFGVENVGLLKIPYNADWQYYSEGQYRFNGHDSIFWLMVEDTFKSELAAKALALYDRSRGLNYSTFYEEQIVDNQNETAPAMTNQDMILKFDTPWATGFMNYSNKPPTYETPEYKYLQRGTRTAQKTSFIFKRSMLLSSKYQAQAFKNDRISFRYGADLSAAQAVIECQANQIMYPAVSFGDNKGWTQALELVDGTAVVDGLVYAGQKCRIRATSSAKGQDTLFIAGASVLTDIGDLSVFKPYELKVGAGKNLKKLILGSNASGYINAVTSGIENLSACAILEEINIRNCTAFNTLDVSANGLIKRVYAAGSGTGTISLPAGGVLDTIEYGAQTTNITIINHSSLQHFSYENSGSNNYANLNKLRIENTPNVPVVDIVIATLGHLTNGLRLINIDVNLGNDPTFLETITSQLADGKYLDDTGSLNTNRTPEITGTVRITNIRQSLLAKVNQMYPRLNVIYNQRDDEYEVKYENYDGTLLYTDYGISTDSVKDPVYDTNPITNAPYISMPVKPEDVQYRYRFGTYTNQGNYRRFSGWVRKGTTTSPTSDTKITGAVTYIAYYPTVETRQYTVRWFAEPNTEPLLSYTEDYGTPIGTFDQPETSSSINFVRAKQVGNGVKVFKGWDRPVGKLVGNVDVYAQWETSTINGDTQNVTMESLTAADLYAIATQVDSSGKDRLLRGNDHIGEPIMIHMGHDFDYTAGVTTTNLLGSSEKIVFEGNTDEARVFNAIQPLSVNQDWTLAIDYKFLMSDSISFGASGEFVLASCYQNANSSIQGFKLSLVKNSSASANDQAIQVSWGNQTQTIDYASVDNTSGLDDRLYFKSYRNVVVLTHNADEPNKLTVYYVPPTTTNTNQGATGMGADIGLGVQTATLTWSNAATIQTPLILGGNYSGSTTNIEASSARRPAQGVVYWAKYWTADLGERSCSEIAAWPHETVPFYLSGYNGASGAVEQIYEGSELSFVAAQGMGDRYQFSSRNGANDDEYAGWFMANARTVCNDLIYKGMPTAYQSIIAKTSINSASLYIADQSRTAAHKVTEDYLFLPAEREVNRASSTYDLVNREIQNRWLSPWHWMVFGNLNNVYGFVSGSSTTLEIKTITDDTYHTNDRYFRYRFLGHYIKPTSRIFAIATDPSSRSWTYNSATIRVQSGDVWVNNDGTAYMYFTNEEIAEGQRVDIVVTNGGWKRADIWHLRTYNIGANSGGENLFEKVGYNGEMLTTPTGTTLIDNGRILCPEFTI